MLLFLCIHLQSVVHFLQAVFARSEHAIAYFGNKGNVHCSLFALSLTQKTVTVLVQVWYITISIKLGYFSYCQQ